MSNYSKLNVDLQRLVQQLILVESQKGPHPLSLGQMESIVNNVYKTFCDTSGTQTVETSETEEEEQITVEMALIKNPPAELKNNENWKYEASRDFDGAMYSFYAHKTEKDMWCVTRLSEAMYGYMPDPASMPIELLNEIFKKVTKL